MSERTRDEQTGPHGIDRRGTALPAIGDDEEYAVWASLVRGRVGLHFDASRRHVLTRAVAERSRALGLTARGEYLARVKGPEAPVEEWQALLELLVTQETSFFREPDTFDVFASTVLPNLLAAQFEGIPLHAWSAGCSTGEEAYSLVRIPVHREHPFRFKVNTDSTDAEHGFRPT